MFACGCEDLRISRLKSHVVDSIKQQGKNLFSLSELYSKSVVPMKSLLHTLQGSILLFKTLGFGNSKEV